MGRYKCPQCGRRFASVGEMLSHTQDVHTTQSPYADRGAVAPPARDMPTGEPGPVATERARRTGFDLEPTGGDDDRGFAPPGSEQTGGEGTGEGQNTAIGTIIALLIVAALIILNLLAGGE